MPSTALIYQSLNLEANAVARTIDELIADLPPDQQEEIARRYEALRQTLPPPEREKTSNGPPAAQSSGLRSERHS